MRDVGEQFGVAALDTVGRLLARAQERRPLPADLLEAEDAYLVVFDAPGVDAADLQVRYADGAVEVSLAREPAAPTDFEMRFPGRVRRLEGRTQLPADASVDPDAAAATLRANGTLEVRIPKGASPNEE